MWKRLWQSLFTKDPTPASPSAAPLSETDFLALVRPAGLDWRRTADELAAAYGVRPVRGGSPAAFLPPTTVLTPFPLEFYVRVPGRTDGGPPDAYDADLELGGGPERDFRSAGAALAAALGNGREGGAGVNARQRTWPIGVFTVRLLAWPPHLNKGKRVPGLLTVSSKIPHAPPDESLRRVRELPPGCFLDAGRIPLGGGAWRLQRENFATRLNPPGAFADVGGDRPLIWRDPEGSAFGVSGPEMSLRFERSGSVALRALLVGPARGTGYRELAVVLRRPAGGEFNVTLLSWPWAADVPDFAEELSRFWELPLATAHGLDD